MAKNKNGYVPPKGKTSGNGRESSGLNDAFAGADPETENQINASYLTDDGELNDNVSVRHPNRHLHKGEDVPEFKQPPGNG